jgi:hypothetical protein
MHLVMGRGPARRLDRVPVFADNSSSSRQFLACELYQSWGAARQETDEALRRWNAAPYGQKRAGYLAYRAAVDREDAAAEAFIRADVSDDE